MYIDIYTCVFSLHTAHSPKLPVPFIRSTHCMVRFCGVELQ